MCECQREREKERDDCLRLVTLIALTTLITCGSNTNCPRNLKNLQESPTFASIRYIYNLARGKREEDGYYRERERERERDRERMEMEMEETEIRYLSNIVCMVSLTARPY